MRGIERPLIIYASRKPFHDRCAEDMKCGDLDEKTLKERFGLLQVSERVNGYSFQKLAYKPFFTNMEARITITGEANA